MLRPETPTKSRWHDLLKFFFSSKKNPQCSQASLSIGQSSSEHAWFEVICVAKQFESRKNFLVLSSIIHITT